MSGRSYDYIVKETAISVAINMLLSAAFFVALFHGRSPVEWWGSHRLALDFLPQTFMVALMGSLVPGLLTRHRLRVGRIVVTRDVHAQSVAAVIARALAIAVLATLGFGGGAIAAVAALDLTQIAFSAALLLKVLFGGVVALVATPIALRKAFGAAQAAPKGAPA